MVHLVGRRHQVLGRLTEAAPLKSSIWHPEIKHILHRNVLIEVPD